MRQWLCDPKILCRKHLLGEHVEIHMFVGHINKGKKVTKFLSNNLLEVESLESRHEELVKEMESRGYKHNSPFQGLLPHNIPNTKIDKKAALVELLRRCPECNHRLFIQLANQLPRMDWQQEIYNEMDEATFKTAESIKTNWDKVLAQPSADPRHVLIKESQEKVPFNG